MGKCHRRIRSIAGGFLVLFAVFLNITSLQAEEPPVETFGLESEPLYTSSNLTYSSPRATDYPRPAETMEEGLDRLVDRLRGSEFLGCALLGRKAGVEPASKQ